MKPPKFLMPADSFWSELKKRTNQYFVEVKSKPSGNMNLYVKAAILITGYLGLYTHLVFFTSPYIIVSLLECVLFGALTSAIGFNIMHDGAHGSFSKKKWVNEVAGLSLNMLGANVFIWKTKHNIVHHTYTNIEGVDDDIDARPFLRLCDTQKHYKAHRFQHLYFFLIYSSLYLYWIFFTDYKKYFTREISGMPIKKMTSKDHITFWGFKAFHFLQFVVVPIYFLGFMPWLIGFLLYTLCTGFILSIVFQLAHTVEEAHFPVVNVATNVLEDEWAIHQLKTTANFATRNKLVSWYTGGLNYQIEHHLFPHISHIHYPAISVIVKQVCQEYNIPYIEFMKMRSAVSSHISHLKHMGVA
ncbi:MAG: acyl-CoA desaturase [Cytophagales bacterium]|nr:acyl-CoA desaturase [Cytophaga sp.]